MKYHIGSLNEILRTFLHRDTTKEGNHLLLIRMVGTRDSLQFFLQWINGIVHGVALTRILMVLVDNRLTCQLRHAHNTIGIVHTIFLNGINGGVHLTARTVEIRSVNVDTQWLTTNVLGMDSSRISQPVVCMNDVEFLRTSHNTCNDGIIIDFLMQVAGIATCKFHTSQVVDIHVIEIRVDMVTILEVIFRTHDIAYPTVDIIILYVAPCDRHSIHGNNLTCRTVFVAPWFGQAKNRINITLCMKTL